MCQEHKSPVARLNPDEHQKVAEIVYDNLVEQNFECLEDDDNNDKMRRDFALKVSTQVLELQKKLTTVGVIDVRTIQDAKLFLAQVIIGDNIGLSFHPDTDFRDYIHIGGGETYLDTEAMHLNTTLAEVENVIKASGQDIYAICNQILFAAGMIPVDESIIH